MVVHSGACTRASILMIFVLSLESFIFTDLFSFNLLLDLSLEHSSINLLHEKHKLKVILNKNNFQLEFYKSLKR